MSKTNGSEFKIEKGVPLPKGRTVTSKYPWADMEVGDSFSISDTSQRDVSAAGRAYGLRNGMKFATRKQDDGSVRVWRTA